MGLPILRWWASTTEMVCGGCQPFWSSIPIEGILGNRVVALYTLVGPCRVLSENLAWYLKRLVLTTPFQCICIWQWFFWKNQNPYTSKKEAWWSCREISTTTIIVNTTMSAVIPHESRSQSDRPSPSSRTAVTSCHDYPLSSSAPNSGCR